LDARELRSKILRGGPAKYHQQNENKGKQFARERIDLLLDKNSDFIEDGLFANNRAEDLPADGVITGFGKLFGQTIAVIANDSTVKAGSWGKRTVEKMIRLQEEAEKLQCPIFYFIDSAGARLTDQAEMFPGKRGAGRIFYNQVRLSGYVPQICILFGPSAAGGAYIPTFCDIALMVENNASMYLGSPRMAEVVIKEKVTLEEMGGSTLHTTQSGCADLALKTEAEAIAWARKWMSLWFDRKISKDYQFEKPKVSIRSIIPESPEKGYDIHDVIHTIVDKDQFLELKPTYAPEIVCGLGKIEGQVIGIVANQPKVKGGVIFCNSADKAARFVDICNAYEIPLLFLCDVPGFMIGSHVERQGIIRHGARFLGAISEATVPKVSLIIRKAYGAGLYAMNGPAFEPDCCLALPTAKIAVMGSGPAMNAVHFNHLASISDPQERQNFLDEKISEYMEDIDIWKLASDLIIDDVIDFESVRTELGKRFRMYKTKNTNPGLKKRNAIRPM
jgi:methylmalonyl-CoA decarboxylase subunit alpha